MQAGRGLLLIDPNDDLVDDVIERATGLGGRDDVICLDLRSPDVAFGLNPFACVDSTNPLEVAQTAERVVGIFKKVWGDMSWIGRMGDLLASCAHTLVANPGTTLADLPSLLTDDRARQRYVARVRNRVVSDYWRYEYDSMSKAERRQVYGP